MIIDEVSMLDCKVMESLHNQLTIAKSKLEIEFGGMNMIFISNFLQLQLTCSHKSGFIPRYCHIETRPSALEVVECSHHLKGTDEAGRRP
jgi:hypothetical protein